MMCDMRGTEKVKQLENAVERERAEKGRIATEVSALCDIGP